jgi:hypothetical protein
MDEIVRQALAKWPNVPHCYHWLALDARGSWRMRDERAQVSGLPGDKILRNVLSDFINRNYTCDDQGRWYFQNGPQRVYVDLEATPYIARTDPAHGFLLHTGEPLPPVDAAWITESGQFILEFAGKAAQVDDRDGAACVAALRRDGAAVDDDGLLIWMKSGAPGSSKNAGLSMLIGKREVPVRSLASAAVAAQFGFVQRPEPG